MNNKWFVNMSNIPPLIFNLLQLSNNFGLSPSIDKKFAVHEFIKDLENNNHGFNKCV